MSVIESGNKKGITRSIVTLLTGTTIAQAIPVAISPILTRIYSPDDFGLLALFLSITSILAVAMTARYELAIMLPKDDKDAANLVGLSLLIATLLSIVILLIIIVYGSQIATILGNEDIYNWLFFVPLSLVLTGVFQTFSYWSNRKQHYQRLAVNKVVQSTTTASSNLLIGNFKSGPDGLIIGNIIAQFIATARIGFLSIKKDNLNLSEISFKKMIELAKRYDQFPKVSIWSGLLNTGSVQMPILVLSAFFTSSIVGWYSLSHRVLNMPMAMLGNAVAQVFFQHSSAINKDDPKGLSKTTFNTYRALLFIGVIPMAIIFAFGDYLFSFIFGSEWIIAGQYARILSVWVLLVFISSPLSMLFTVLEKEGTAFLFNIAIFLSRLISLTIGVLFIKDPLITIFLFASSGIIFWLWHCFYVLKLVNIPYGKSIILTISIIVITFSLTSLLRNVLFNAFW